MIGSVLRFAAAVPLLAMTPDLSPIPDEPTSSGRVQDVCSDRSESSGLACAAYLRGIVEGLEAGQGAADNDDGFCLPDQGIDPAQTRAIFLSFVKGEPMRRNEDAAQLLLDALEDMFPCDDGDGALPSNGDQPPPPPLPA